MNLLRIVQYSARTVCVISWSTLVFGSLVYVFTGVDQFGGESGSRWVTLCALTFMSSLATGISYDGKPRKRDSF